MIIRSLLIAFVFLLNQVFAGPLLIKAAMKGGPPKMPGGAPPGGGAMAPPGGAPGGAPGGGAGGGAGGLPKVIHLVHHQGGPFPGWWF